MRLDGCLECAAGEPVGRDVDHVVSALQDRDITVGVHGTGIAGCVAALEGGHVGALESLVVVPQCREGPWWQRQACDDRPRHIWLRDCLPILANDSDVIPWHWQARAPILPADGIILEAADRRPCLCLPPVVQDCNVECAGEGAAGLGVAPLAGHKEVAQAGDVVLADELQLRVLLAHGPQPCGRDEEALDVVLLDDPPIRPRIRRAHRLALIEH
mmetsp:Transcript_124231/g.362648  ORF Transcript_124231/g.362648 Transcript_124231/m.362648 type:complete len:215 (-) Transcript_124231:1116-1760(-)